MPLCVETEVHGQHHCITLPWADPFLVDEMYIALNPRRILRQYHGKHIHTFNVPGGLQIHINLPRGMKMKKDQLRSVHSAPVSWGAHWNLAHSLSNRYAHLLLLLLKDAASLNRYTDWQRQLVCVDGRNTTLVTTGDGNLQVLTEDPLEIPRGKQAQMANTDPEHPAILLLLMEKTH
jgi:hypothetical protein